jgi:ferredoxin
MNDPAPPAPQVSIDAAICIGSGTCTRLAPLAFVMGDDGVAHVADLGDTELTRLERAERSCPTGAIFIESAPD